MKLIMRAYQTLILQPYFRVRTWWPLWYYVLNGLPRSRFNRARPALSSLQQRIVTDLKKDGIAVTSLEELFPGESLLDTFQRWEAAHPPPVETAGKKKFLREYWDLFPDLDLENPFVKFSLTDTVVDIAESYMGMWVRNTQHHLAKTLPDPDRSLIQSQQWHRDPEEKRMCKVFVYLNDVDDTAGPFTYLFGSTYGNKYGSLFPQRPPEGAYPPGDIVLARGGTDVHAMTGKAGTVMFCDTSGLHFGGRATENERIMYTNVFLSPLFSEGARYRVTNPDAVAALPEKQRYLLSGPHYHESKPAVMDAMGS